MGLVTQMTLARERRSSDAKEVPTEHRGERDGCGRERPRGVLVHHSQKPPERLRPKHADCERFAGERGREHPTRREDLVLPYLPDFVFLHHAKVVGATLGRAGPWAKVGPTPSVDSSAACCRLR